MLETLSDAGCRFWSSWTRCEPPRPRTPQEIPGSGSGGWEALGGIWVRGPKSPELEALREALIAGPWEALGGPGKPTPVSV